MNKKRKTKEIYYPTGIEQNENVKYEIVTYFFQNGNISESKFLKNNKSHGLRTLFTPYGKIVNQVNYINGKQKGIAIFFYSRGTASTSFYF